MGYISFGYFLLCLHFLLCVISHQFLCQSDIVKAGVRSTLISHFSENFQAFDCVGKKIWFWTLLSAGNRLGGLLVKASASGAEDPGFESRLRQDFSGSSHTSDLKIGTPVTTLPGAWHYRVSTGTGWPGVSTLWLGEVESWIWNFYLSVAARKIVWADPSLRYTRMLLGR